MVMSREYHYLLHCLSVKEKKEIMVTIWKQHTEEMQMLEGNLSMLLDVSVQCSSSQVLINLGKVGPTTKPHRQQHIYHHLPMSAKVT